MEEQWVGGIERPAVLEMGRRNRKRSVGGKWVGGIEREAVPPKLGRRNRKRSVGSNSG